MNELKTAGHMVHSDWIIGWKNLATVEIITPFGDHRYALILPPRELLFGKESKT